MLFFFARKRQNDNSLHHFLTIQSEFLIDFANMQNSIFNWQRIYLNLDFRQLWRPVAWQRRKFRDPHLNLANLVINQLQKRNRKRRKKNLARRTVRPRTTRKFETTFVTWRTQFSLGCNLWIKCCFELFLVGDVSIHHRISIFLCKVFCRKYFLGW